MSGSCASHDNVFLTSLQGVVCPWCLIVLKGNSAPHTRRAYLQIVRLGTVTEELGISFDDATIAIHHPVKAAFAVALWANAIEIVFKNVPK